MQLECTGKQVKQEALSNVNSTTNKKHCSHFQLSISRDAKILFQCHCRYHRHCPTPMFYSWSRNIKSFNVSHSQSHYCSQYYNCPLQYRPLVNEVHNGSQQVPHRSRNECVT